MRSIEDEKLVDHLVAKQIPIEVCPTSNLCTKAYPSLSEHPVRKLYDKGVNISINSDGKAVGRSPTRELTRTPDPTYFGSDLEHECQLLVDHFGFTLCELKHLMRKAMESSFACEPLKLRLLREKL